MRTVYTSWFYLLLLFSSHLSAQPQVWGQYTAGCIPNAPALAKDGQAYHVIRLHRDRYYGHPELIQSLEALSLAMQPLGKHLLIGDMSQADGGRMPSGHRSHQNGLDADIMLAGWDSDRALSDKQREALAPVSVLTANKKSLDKSRFGTWQQQLLQQAAQLEKVERIFINSLIKQALCKENPNAAWLEKIRPWWGHDGHLHIRLRCPENSPECKGQAAPPKGTGCDASLAWWVKQVTAPPAKKNPTKPRKSKPKPRLPEVCQALQKP